MFYFVHATTFCAFESVLKEGKIIASYYLPSNLKTFIRMNSETKYVHTNIYVQGLQLEEDEKQGIGEITIIIDPSILKYKICYFNKGWIANTDKSIIMNGNEKEVLGYIIKNQKYPFVLQHEALFKKNIPTEFIMGIICGKSELPMVRKYLNKYGFKYVKVFNKFPSKIHLTNTSKV